MTNIPKDPGPARAAVSVHGLAMIQSAAVATWMHDEADAEYHWGRVRETFTLIADALGYELTQKEEEPSECD